MATRRQKRKLTESDGHSAAPYRKSAYGGAVDRPSLEVGFVAGEVLIRVAGDSDGPVVRFTTDEWHAFVAGAKAGDFDLA